jgi:peptide/nickel transport system permease protein
MWGYIGRRLLATLPVLAVVAILVFMMLRLTPGDPAAVIAGPAANSQDILDIREKLGLDKPIATQFVKWVGGMLSGDFGESFFYKKQVSELIADRIEPTLSLAVLTIVLATLIAVPLGTIAAWRQGSWIDRVVMGFSVLGFSVPVFVIGYLMIALFSMKLGWFPVQGYTRLSEGVGGWLHRLVLPAFTLAFIYVAVLARDYPTVQAVILLFSVAYVLINLAIDLLYTLLDPRIRY